MNTPPSSKPPDEPASPDGEPYPTTETIQPHGVLLAFDAQGTLRHFSANLQRVPGLPAPHRCTWNDLPAGLGERISLRLRSGHEEPATIELDGTPYEAIAHQTEQGHHVLELERCEDAPTSPHAALHRIYRSVEPLRRQRTIPDLLATVVQEVQRATGFERVMAYRFHPDASGEVVCEARRAGLEDWEGWRYPQDRTPFLAPRERAAGALHFIADTAARPVPLHGVQAGLAPPDLRHSVLRGTAPSHLESLAGLGLRATMELPLVIDGRPWGVIVCLHGSPHRAPHGVRMACDVLAQVTAASIAGIQAASRTATARRNAALISHLSGRASAQDDMRLALSSGPETPAQLVPADASLCLWANGITVFGGEPPQGQLADILAGLDRTGQRLIHTASIRRDFPVLQSHLQPYAGLLACKFDPMYNGWLIWLRKQQADAVAWRGEPGSSPADAAAPLTWQGANQAWREAVRHTSIPWRSAEVEAADSLRDELSHIATTRAVDTDRARTALLAMLGHDLRDPLQSISMAATLLSRTDGGARMGERIRYSSGRMQRLISQVLDLSRLQGGLGLGMEPRDCNLSALLFDLIEEKRQAFPGLPLEPQIEPDLRLQADPDRIAQVITNLLSNARHHGAPRQPIRITARRQASQVLLQVTNHGDPIPPEMLPHLFSPFKPESVGQRRNRTGLGLGLYIAYQVVNGHGGTLGVQCREGLVIFTVTLPAGPAPAQGPLRQPNRSTD
ncbi:ATP-binding protein [Bordetella sp. 2513F-2]